MILFLRAMKIPDKYKTLLSNTGLMFIGTFGSKMISFVMLPFYTTWLSVEDYGTSDIIAVYSTVLLAFISLSIGDAIFVIPSQKTKEEQTSYFTSSLFFSLGCCLFLALLYIVVGVLFDFENGSFTNNIGYICLMTFTTLYLTIFQQFCKSINQVKVFAFTGIVQTLIVAGLGFCLIPKYHLSGYIWCIILSNIVSLFFTFITAKLFQYIKFSSYSKGRLKEMFKYSIPLIPNSVIWMVVSYLNRPLMETYLGMYAIGIYALANKFPTLINTIYNNFSNSWQISVLEQYGKDGFDKFYNRITLFVYVGLALAVAVFTLFSDVLITSFLNENYYEAIKYIPILCLSCVFIALGSITGSVFSAVRLSKYYFYSSVWSAVTAVVFNYLLIERFGIDGACWACVISYVAGGVSRMLYAKKFVKFSIIPSIVLISALLIVVVCSISYFGNYLVASILTFVLLLIFLSQMINKNAIGRVYKNK